MSKKSKQKNREEHLQSKRARRTANKARYAELKRLGVNSKSKRSIKAGKRKLALSVSHPDGHCGNIACKICFSI